MDLPRIHAVELHDLPSCPPFVRETIVETLGNALRWGRIYDPLAETFGAFCQAAGADAVLDLCSGTGEPIAVLLDCLQRQGLPSPRFALSDLYPNVPRLRRVAARFPGLVEAVETPVDATAVDPAVDRPARTIISAFHHFPPPVATRILADCVAQRRAVFILEPTIRKLLGGLGMTPWLAAAALANPFVAPANRGAKLLGTYASPLTVAAITWDSVVSLLRTYTEAELTAMAGDNTGFQWTFRRVRVRPGVVVTAFMGWPVD